MRFPWTKKKAEPDEVAIRKELARLQQVFLRHCREGGDLSRAREALVKMIEIEDISGIHL